MSHPPPAWDTVTRHRRPRGPHDAHAGHGPHDAHVGTRIPAALPSASPSACSSPRTAARTRDLIRGWKRWASCSSPPHPCPSRRRGESPCVSGHRVTQSRRRVVPVSHTRPSPDAADTGYLMDTGARHRNAQTAPRPAGSPPLGRLEPPRRVCLRPRGQRDAGRLWLVPGRGPVSPTWCRNEAPLTGAWRTE